MIYCSLCFKTKEKPGSKDFFKVPKDKRTRKKWGEICRIDFKKKTTWICIEHFLPSDIQKTGKKRELRPRAVPFIPPVREPAKILQAAYNSELKNQISDYTEDTISVSSTEENLEQNYKIEEGEADSCTKQNVVWNSNNGNLTQNCKKEELPPELNINYVPTPQMQENFVMEIPVKKTVFCTRPTQTNTRICGLIETSEFADDFRLNCFYCSEFFPFEKWKNFTKHLKENHFENEKAFEISDYISDDHDYTPVNLPSKLALQPVSETIGISPESLLPFLGNSEQPTIPIEPAFLYTSDENMAMSVIMDAQEPFIMTPELAHNHLDSMVVNPNMSCTQDDNKMLSANVNTLNKNEVIKSKKQIQKLSVRRNSINLRNKSSKLNNLSKNQVRNTTKQTQRKNVLSRFLKRTVTEETESEVKEVFSSTLIEMKHPSTPIISYEYSPSPILNCLLDNMRNYPALWQFNSEPYNDAFCSSIEEMCDIINEKWSLNIEHLTMRRSINRVLRFYCYLFPNENIENIHPFTCYYDKCAEFLPSSVNEIAYARCYNCYKCFKCDSDLKRHLLKEESFKVMWPHKCVECKEYFALSEEYEFHKSLPHYVEVFRCEPCKKKYFRRNIYNKHMSDVHPIENNEERKFKCDKCEKTFKLQAGLAAHKVYHGERKHNCHLCSKSFHEKAGLKIHLKNHRKQYDFICEVCAKEFVTQSALTVHMDKHTGRKITCNICNIRLRRSSLSRHLRLLHRPGDENLCPKLPLAKGKIRTYKRLVKTKPFLRKKESERRRYQCKLCKIDFERYKPLATHNKELHSDIPKWPCQLCTTEFTLKENLKCHYRKKHSLHVIQVYKLVEEGNQLDEVLSIKPEQLDKLAEKTSDMNIPKVKSEYLSDDNSLEQDNMESFNIQEEIMKVTDNITKEEVKIDYMSDFFKEILK